MSRFINSTIGEYRLVDFLGRGGMGEVYRGVHVKLGRYVAVKILNNPSGDPNMVKRFLHEARIQSNLRHEGIATLYDFLEWYGMPVIIMEFVDGQTLGDYISTRGPFPPAEAARIVGFVAETLGYVHSQGIIHRDLKCANIKLTPTGQVKLLDFGIAMGATETRLTQAGFVVGTFRNMAPELALGQSASVSSDIWALGVTMYEMVTGKAPFDAPSAPELFTKIAKAEFIPPSSLVGTVPKPLEQIICKCLKKNAAQRYQSAVELRDALAQVDFGSGQSHKTPQPRKIDSSGTKPRNEPVPTANDGWKKIAIGAAIAAAVVVAILLVAQFLSPGPVNNVTANDAKTTASSSGTTAAEPGAAMKTVELEITDGDQKAQVYEGEKLLGDTPLRLTRKIGDRVEVTLKKQGYEDKSVQFDVSEGEFRPYTYTMQPIRTH
jgi:serine/threonine-protein kinase